MRARMALKYAGISVNILEVSLKDKPAEMLKTSPKGTVPVLVLPDGRVLEQSLDIMRWALLQQDPDAWLAKDNALTQQLIAENDGSFKEALDRYKYASRFPDQSVENHRNQAEVFIQKLETNLQKSSFLLGSTVSFADIAIFPFIRQFVAADPIWFEATNYQKVKTWLQKLVSSELFTNIMKNSRKK